MKKWLWKLGCLILIVVLFFMMRESSRNYTNTFTLPEIKEETPDKIRVATYNVKLLNQGNDLQAFEKEMKLLQPDILCVQEVDKNAIRSGNQDMVKKMAQVADMPYAYFYQSMWILDGYYGIGILSKYPIESITSISLPNSLLKEPRILAKAKILVGNSSLDIYHTHLSFQDRALREKQIAYISKEIQNMTSTIFMGDFNTFTKEDFFHIEGMTAINQKSNPLITFRSFGFPDNIYYSNDLHVIHYDTMKSTFSDHNILYADVQFT